ncbi:efflux RND transporter periplasmic adaptor subunit (plasmid) [Photobacterium sp. GJ3]|uniref:efflux RND transporter periplasmic adaptor subunit n=1 Tax=Photobacterium sp. GJ3 TaxID=2829502 RepID=UPI001B8B3933|nr:efflux RND transporter periplasmic adaptor subunit [Photobacterium sp. GJ3]QUJ70328.1 efflux RND transporter periplasmic adaptor subunit [Photobacterium sp. GJ3]
MRGLRALSRWLSARPYFYAIGITIAIIVWMLSGQSKTEDHTAQVAGASGAAATETAAQAPIPKVRITTFQAEQVYRSLTLYGKTEPSRQATVKAEVTGRVIEVVAQRGSFVQEGQIIALLAKDDRPEQLRRAKAQLKQRQIEYDGVKQLNAKGFQGRARLAEAEAALVDAQANVASLTLALEKTTIRAPLSGILNDRLVEVGDYAQVGDPIGTIADINPLIVRADVTESDILKIRLHQDANARLVGGIPVSGKVRYISKVANEATNTFRIEVSFDNPDLQLLAGTSAELQVPLEETEAIKVTPAVLALDDVGNLGVKTVEGDAVVFTPVNVVKSDGDGTWLGGFSGQVDVITVGQGFVRPGDRVEAIKLEN